VKSRNEVLLREIIGGRMKGKAFWGIKRQHMLSDIASSGKYLEVKRDSRRSRRMERYRQKRNSANVLHSRPLEEERSEVLK